MGRRIAQVGQVPQQGFHLEAIPKTGEPDAIFGIQVVRYTQFHIASIFGSPTGRDQVIYFHKQEDFSQGRGRLALAMQVTPRGSGLRHFFGMRVLERAIHGNEADMQFQSFCISIANRPTPPRRGCTLSGSRGLL
jgi:hypothetical protein